MIDALFIDPKGPYPRLLGPEHCWDEKRDARTYDGPGPVLLHPPCAAWCQLAGVREARYGYPRGEDGGLFLAALGHLWRVGGVLEHPAYSKAWDAYGLPKPRKGGMWWPRDVDGRDVWVCQVSQCAYGHRARKRTWLLYHSPAGFPPFELDWSEPYVNGSAVCSGMSNRRESYEGYKRIWSAEAKRTPDAFAAVLIELARRSRWIQ